MSNTEEIFSSLPSPSFYSLSVSSDLAAVALYASQLFIWARQWQGALADIGSDLAHEVRHITRDDAHLYPLAVQALSAQRKEHAIWHSSSFRWGLGNEGVLFVRKQARQPERLVIASRDGGNLLARACGSLLDVLSLKSLVGLQTQQTSAELARHLDHLRARDRDVLLRMLAGSSNIEIAHQLGLSPRTIESYQRHLYRSIGAHSRAEAIVIGMAGYLNFL